MSPLCMVKDPAAPDERPTVVWMEPTWSVASPVEIDASPDTVAIPDASRTAPDRSAVSMDEMWTSPEEVSPDAWMPILPPRPD